jgi:hypothetical protein
MPVNFHKFLWRASKDTGKRLKKMAFFHFSRNLKKKTKKMILTLFINQITPNFHTIYKKDHLSLLEKKKLANIARDFDQKWQFLHPLGYFKKLKSSNQYFD